MESCGVLMHTHEGKMAIQMGHTQGNTAGARGKRPASRSRRLSAWMTAAVAVTMVAAGCSGGSGNSDGSDGGSGSGGGEPKSGGNLTLGLFTSTKGLDPIDAVGSASALTDGNFHAAIYGLLVEIDDETRQVVPGMAESLESDNGVDWTLSLRDGVKFTDGTPYDAEAVKFNWARIADPANASGNVSVAGQMQNITVKDPLTLTFSIPKPDFQFARQIATRIPYVGSPTAIKKLGSKFSAEPVGAGPFVVDQWVQGTILSLKKNPDYWDESKPYLDGLTIKTIGDPTQRFNALTAGEVDAQIIFPNQAIVKKSEDAGFPVKVADIPGGFGLNFNTAKPPFNDSIARQAVATAIDLDLLNTTLNSGVLTPPKTFFPKDNPFYDENAQLPTFDQKKAQELFDEYAAKTGAPLKFTFTVGEVVKSTAEFMQAQLAKYDNVSFDIDLNQSQNAYLKMVKGDFQMAITGTNLGDPEPDFTAQFSTEGTQNFTGYSNPEVDAALEKGRGTKDEAERAAAYSIVQRNLVKDLPYFLYQPWKYSYSMTDKVGGWKTHNAGMPNLDELFLK